MAAPFEPATAASIDLTLATTAFARGFGYLLLAGAVIAAEALIELEALLHRTLPVPWR